MYYRGVAFRQDKKPAQAISDLTRALWLKAGLDGQLRADAEAQRSAAYREAGLPDQAETKVAMSGGPSPGGREPPAAAPGTTTVAVGSGGSGLGGIFGSWFGGGSSAATGSIAEKPVAAKQVPTAVAARPPTAAAEAAAAGQRVATKSWSSVTQVATKRPEAQPAARVAAAQPAPPRAVRPAQTESAVRVKPVTAAAPKAAAPAAPMVAKAQVAERPVRQPQPAVAPGVARSGLPKFSPASAGGRYAVQVAAVRTAEQAQQVVATVQQRYGASLGGRAPLVEQTVVGNMGTIYRVRLGPFATANETHVLCSVLKRDGLPCMVASQ